MNIVAVNIKSHGGINLLNYLVNTLDFKEKSATIHIPQTIFPKLKSTRFVKLKRYNSVQSIKLFFSPNQNSFYFGNIPPFSLKKNNCVLFIQNVTYCESSIQLLSEGLFKAIFFKYWIKIFSQFCRTIIVQTEETAQKIEKLTNHKSIKVLPFYDDSIKVPVMDVYKYDFCYPCSISPNKNLDLLFDTLNFMAQEMLRPKVALTINFEHLTYRQKNKCKYLDNIEFVGALSAQDSLRLISVSKVLLFTSKYESFGLPLIESAMMSKPIIAPKLNYVTNIVDNAILFEPNDKQDLSRKIRLTMKNKQSAAKLKVSNNIEVLLQLFDIL